MILYKSTIKSKELSPIKYKKIIFVLRNSSILYMTYTKYK